MTDPTSLPLRRRSLFAAAAAAAGLAALPGATGVATASAAPATGAHGVPGELVRRFRSPGTATAAGFRWWWPHGAVDPVEIAREVDQVADAGFGALEVADVTHSLRARGVEVDLRRQGWGTESWRAGVKAALRRAAERGVRIDITVGPSWPAAVPTITPDDDAACTELAHGRVDLAAGETHDGPLPDPVVAPAAASTRRVLEAVQAFRVVDASGQETVLDPESYVDLTDRVEGERLTWTAPAEGEWVLLAYWRRGSAQEPEAGPHTEPRCYVVDHFGAAGVGAVIDLWRDTVLDDEMRALLRAAGGQLFEDSLEIETHATIWTPGMLGEFERRAGYDLRPWLPAVVEADERYVFSFGAPRTTRLRDDFNQVLSDLYRDHHLLPLQRFAAELDMGIRIQPYGLETDTLEHAGVVDVPETESLGFKNLDDYRIMAGGRDLAGRTVMSCEAACYFGAAYHTLWERALTTINSIFVAGVNQLMLHGFSYADAPEVTWPGYAAFSPYYDGAIGYGESWGPRTPQWRHVPDIAAYLARTQLVLQTGTPRYDVVFLRQKGWASTGIGPVWITNNGTKLGWSHGFATAGVLDDDAVTVRDGRLAPDGPGYRALVLEPDKLRGRELTISPSMARRLLSFGRAGLPIVLVGDWSQAEPTGLAQPGETEQVRALMGQVAALPTTRTVLDENQVGAVLAELGVEPEVRHDDSTVMHVHRVTGDVDLYYLANAKHAENRRLSRVTQDVWLTATSSRSVPYLLDAWTGEVTPVVLHERDGDRVRVRVDLQPGQSTIIALAPPQPGNRPSATATDADDVLGRGSQLLARTTRAGRVSVTRADGRRLSADVARVRGPVDLTDWELELTEYLPGATATQTRTEVHRRTLRGLLPWSQLAGLEDASGVGRYTAVVDLGRDWTEHDGAWLELGEVTDTFRVTVNGERLGACDVLDTTVDVGHLLRPGRNTVEVEVTSTLLNRLRTVTPAVYAVAQRAAYGLIGPVRLVPYVDARVR